MKKIMIGSLLGLSGTCFAAQIEDGNFLYELCNQDEKACIFYVSGVYSGIQTGILLAAKDNRTAFTTFRVCMPAGVSHKQASEVFTKYLKDHPETRHLDADILALRAWREAFPCE